MGIDNTLEIRKEKKGGGATENYTSQKAQGLTPDQHQWENKIKEASQRRWNRFSSESLSGPSPPPPHQSYLHLFSKIPYVHFWLKFTLLQAVPVESKVNISSPKPGLSPEHLQSGSCLLPQFLYLLQKQKAKYENQAVRRLTVFYSWSIYSQFNCIFNANYNTLIFN